MNPVLCKAQLWQLNLEQTCRLSLLFGSLNTLEAASHRVVRDQVLALGTLQLLQPKWMSSTDRHLVRRKHRLLCGVREMLRRNYAVIATWSENRPNFWEHVWQARSLRWARYRRQLRANIAKRAGISGNRTVVVQLRSAYSALNSCHLA